MISSDQRTNISEELVDRCVDLVCRQADEPG
jgi:hypothetical protein